MKIACIQPRAAAVGDYDRTFARMRHLTTAAADSGAELVLQPEMAYPSYFLGLDQAACDRALARSGDYLRTMAGLARDKRIHVVACTALQDSGNLYNAAVMYDDHGREVARTYKAALWHFDRFWFSPGTTFRAFDTRLGRLGMMICADARLPEIPRLLALDGARLILEPANLVSSADRPCALANQQHAFLLSARARENGVWLAMTNKCGIEAETVTFLGRTLVVDPEGTLVAQASPDREEKLYYDLDMDLATGPITPRRPELYGRIASGDAVPCPALAADRAGQNGELYATLAQFPAATVEEYRERAAHHFRAAAFLGTHLLCLPPTRFPIRAGTLAGQLRLLLPEGVIAVVPGWDDDRKEVVLASRGMEYGAAWRTHGTRARSDDRLNAVPTPLGRLGVMFGEEGLVPEVARTLMLDGAEVLVWYDDQPRPLVREIMQARAAENRIFVLRVTDGAGEDVSTVITPDAAVAACTFAGATQSVSATLLLALARSKTVVPGTDVLSVREGPLYAGLTR